MIKSTLRAFERAPASVPAAVMLTVCDVLKGAQACSVLEKLYSVNADNAQVQARYLDVLCDVDFGKARELQGKLSHQLAQAEDEDLVQRLLDEGMPQRRKDKKSNNID